MCYSYKYHVFPPAHKQEYDVACSFRTMSMQLQREKTAKWTVWKRYSDFEKLDAYVHPCIIFLSLRPDEALVLGKETFTS